MPWGEGALRGGSIGGGRARRAQRLPRSIAALGRCARSAAREGCAPAPSAETYWGGISPICDHFLHLACSLLQGDSTVPGRSSLDHRLRPADPAPCIRDSPWRSSRSEPIGHVRGPCSQGTAPAAADSIYMDDTSEEAFLIAQQFPIILKACKHGNLLAMLVMLVMMKLEARAIPFASINVAFNAFAFIISTCYIPQVEQRHGIHRAHHVFVRASVLNYLGYFVTTWIAGNEAGSLLGCTPSCSPLLVIMLSFLCAMLTAALYLVMAPLAYRCLIHVSLVSCLFVSSPSNMTLPHSHEVVVILIGLAVGEIVGMTLQYVIRQTFAMARADYKLLASQLEQVDEERKRVLSRLHQLDSEKERLSYDLALEQQRSAAVGVRSKTGPSSYGSNEEVDDLLHPAAPPMQQNHTAGASPDEAARRLTDASPVVSARMRKRSLTLFTGVLLPY